MSARETQYRLRRSLEAAARNGTSEATVFNGDVARALDAFAEVRRLREALERMMVWVGLAVFDPERRRAMFEDIKKARAALASTPNAEPTRTDAERWLSDGPEEPGGTLAFHAAPSAKPTPRDMRVAEAVWMECVETADASDEVSRRVAEDLRALDLAAVVAQVAGREPTTQVVHLPRLPQPGEYNARVKVTIEGAVLNIEVLTLESIKS